MKSRYFKLRKLYSYEQKSKQETGGGSLIFSSEVENLAAAGENQTFISEKSLRQFDSFSKSAI